MLSTDWIIMKTTREDMCIFLFETYFTYYNITYYNTMMLFNPVFDVLIRVAHAQSELIAITLIKLM